MAGVTGSIPVAPTIAGHNPLSDFFSLYSHEFVRVACCVPRTRVADAPYNLGETLRLAAEGDRTRTTLMVFPELGLSSYAIEDLLLQDALLDEVEQSIARVAAASWAWCPRPISPTTASSTKSAISSPAPTPSKTPSNSPARTCRSARTCCSARPAACRSPSMSRSAKTSGYRCRPRATPRWRAPR